LPSGSPIIAASTYGTEGGEGVAKGKSMKKEAKKPKKAPKK
jgi:hypothetical protein